MEILFALAAIGALYFYETKMNGLGSGAPAPTPGPSGDAEVLDAIQKGIIDPLGLPGNAGPILLAQYILETNHGKAPYFPTTNNLFNRHTGSGRGDWRGAGKPESAWVQGIDFVYVSPGDPNIRCFDDVYQCARDMAELLQDPLYSGALAGLRKGSAPDYFNALRAAGFSTQDTYAEALQRVYDSIA